jgi:hypothetical protein
MRRAQQASISRKAVPLPRDTQNAITTHQAVELRRFCNRVRPSSRVRQRCWSALLTAGFFPSLQVRLYLRLGELNTIGLFGSQVAIVCNTIGVKLAAVVHLRDDQRAVDVWMRCGDTVKEKNLGSAWLKCILQVIEEAQDHSCPGTVVQIRCIDSVALRKLGAAPGLTPVPVAEKLAPLPVTQDTEEQLLEMVRSGSLQRTEPVRLTQQDETFVPNYVVVNDLFPFGELYRPAAQVSIEVV